MTSSKKLSDRFERLAATVRQTADNESEVRLACIEEAIKAIDAIAHERLRANAEDHFSAILEGVQRSFGHSDEDIEEAWGYALAQAANVKAFIAARACGLFVEMAAAGNREGILRLIDCGYDIEARAVGQRNPLELCLFATNASDTFDKSSRAIQCLLDAGARVDSGHLVVRHAAIRAQLEAAYLRQGLTNAPPSNSPRIARGGAL